MKTIEQKYLEQALSYAEYRQLSLDVAEKGETTGPTQSEALHHYTVLNNQRMKRLDKTTKLTEETIQALQAIDQPLTWLVISEAWCGDAAQILPVLNKMAEQNPLIELKVVLRDENLELMDQFLTNGGRSIPKLIHVHPNNQEVFGDFGPRPVEVQAKVMEAKDVSATLDEEGKKAYFDEVKEWVQRWYLQDKTISIQKEVLNSLTPITTK